jgi:hypothetical protein
LIANTLQSDDKKEVESSENVEVVFGPDESNTESEFQRGSHLNYIDSEPSDKRDETQKLSTTNDLPYMVRPSTEKSFEVQRIQSLTKHNSAEANEPHND